MPTDIVSSGAAVKVAGDQLEQLALEIEQFHREATLQIAKRLDQARDIFRYRRDEGGFTGWVQNRLKYSVATVYRLLNLHERFGESFSQCETLGATALYALAAPGTPEEAVEEIAARLEAGEKPSVAEVKGAIARAKKPADQVDLGGAAGGNDVDHGGGVDHHADQAGGDHASIVEEQTTFAPKPPATKVDAPEPETLLAHWMRCPAEQTALLDQITVTGVLTAASTDFKHELLRATVPVNPFARLCEMKTAEIAQKLCSTLGKPVVKDLGKRLLTMSKPKSINLDKTKTASGKEIYAQQRTEASRH
jgi:hypothetical protein